METPSNRPAAGPSADPGSPWKSRPARKVRTAIAVAEEARESPWSCETRLVSPERVLCVGPSRLATNSVVHCRFELPALDEAISTDAIVLSCQREREEAWRCVLYFIDMAPWARKALERYATGEGS